MGIIKEKDERDGYVYDAAIKGGDTTFWAEIAGTIAVDTSDSTSAIRVNADRFHSFLQHQYGNYEFSIRIPAPPGATTDQSWGLRSPSDDTTYGGDSGKTGGGIYFQIDTNSTFQTISYDDFGNRQATSVTWDTDWDTIVSKYQIRWEQDRITFLVNDTVVSTHSTRVPTHLYPLELRNATASNMDVEAVRVSQAGAII